MIYRFMRIIADLLLILPRRIRFLRSGKHSPRRRRGIGFQSYFGVGSHCGGVGRQTERPFCGEKRIVSREISQLVHA